MLTMTLPQFLSTYIPGLWLLVSLLFVHIVTSTIVHIKKKDFSFGEWPKYMINFVLYIIFIIFANAVMDLAINEIRNSVIQTVFVGIQAMVYIQAIGYYINNILKHLSELGVPVNPDFKEAIGGVVSQVKSMMTGRRY